jgi:hypothetical protein
MFSHSGAEERQRGTGGKRDKKEEIRSGERQNMKVLMGTRPQALLAIALEDLGVGVTELDGDVTLQLCLKPNLVTGEQG